MADQKPCMIRAPHEAHPWQETKPYDGVFTNHINSYHLCPGRVWTNNEVYNHLQNLIREALKKPRILESGGLTHDAQIMEEIWPEVMGFLQPGDTPFTVTLGGDNIPDAEYIVSPGRIMEIPADPMTRMADAVEKIEKHLRKTHWRNGE